MLILMLKSVVLFLSVVIAMRIMGKRQIGELQPFEFVIAIMLSELAAIPIENSSIPIYKSLIPILTLTLTQLLFSYLILKSSIFRKIVCGTPKIVIKDGKIIEKHLRKEFYTINDLLEQLRINGFFNLEDIEYGILETNGDVSIYQYPNKQMVTPTDLNIKLNNTTIPLDLILDGKVIENNMEFYNINSKQLLNAIKKEGGNSFKEVFYAYINKDKKITVQLKN